MKKNRKSNFILAGIIILGMAYGSYLVFNSKTPIADQTDISTQLIKSLNDSIFTIIKKDPAMAYQWNNVIESSPYLKSQKQAFLKKYYGREIKSTNISEVRLMELRLQSRLKQK